MTWKTRVHPKPKLNPNPHLPCSPQPLLNLNLIPIRTPYILYPISYILAAAFFSQRRLRYSVNPISAHKIPTATYTFGSGIAVT